MTALIWAKTEDGRLEMQARALVKERAQRNLLLMIDGIRTEELLLTSIAGISAADFAALQGLGLIAPLTAAAGARPAPTPRPSPLTVDLPVDVPAGVPTEPPADAAPLDYGAFTAALTRIISKELGLRGFVLTLAVERAGTIEELQAVAQRTLAQVADRKGEAVAAAARRTLYGG